VQMLDRIEAVTGRKVPTESLFSGATIENLAKAVESQNEATVRRIIPVQRSGSLPPLFFMHGDLGGGGTYSIQLAHHLGQEQPLYTVNPHAVDERCLLPSIEDMAADNVAKVLEIEAAAPLYL